jgi:hypothetical protein
MEDFFSELLIQEKQIEVISREIQEAGSPISDENQSKLAQIAGKYSKEINNVLKIYTKVDYKQDPAKKTEIKAQIKYSYELLDKLLKIVRVLESTLIISDILKDNLILLDQFLFQKQDLLISTYTVAAKKELHAFYKSSIREKLEADLQRKMNI